MHRITRRSFLRSTGIAAGALTAGVAAPAAAIEGLASAQVSAAADHVLALARAWFTPEQAYLIGEFDDTHNVFDDGSIELLLWPGDRARLLGAGIRHEVTVPDLAARDAAIAAEAAGAARVVEPQPGETTTGDYRTLAVYNADMQRLATENPSLVKLLTLPFKSLQGRTIYGLEIAEDVNRRDGRPVFYNDGVHHAREWPAAEVPIMWAFDLVEGYKKGDERIVNIVRNVRNIIVPVVNVDGFLYSRTGIAGQGRTVDSSATGALQAAGLGMQYWRKNMRSQVANTGQESAIPQNGIVPTTPGAFGVDPNRNYSYHWGGDGSSASFNGETYRGTQPFSEPESRNVQWVHRNYQVVAGITHHTSGNLVLWAWGDTAEDAPDDVVLARVGFACGAYNGYRPTKSIDLYVTTGTCSDYTYGTFGSISYTFEHAGSSFHPPYMTTVPPFYANNRGAFMLMCELICMEPDQRGHMLAAVAGNELVTNRLTGDFDENISNTQYTYIGNGLDLRGRYHCVISGRLVNRAGGPVAGTVRLTKDFRNFLWKYGNGANPTGQVDWPEFHDSAIETAADGTFRWVVNPSTRPYAEFLGQREYYRLRVTGPDGRETTQSLFLTRGDVVNLGAIVVG